MSDDQNAPAKDESTEPDSKYYADEVAALRATGYEVQTRLSEKYGVHNDVFNKGIEEGKIVVVRLGERARMLRVADADKVVTAYRKAIEAKEREREATRAKTQGGPERGDVEAFRAEIRALGMVQAAQTAELKKISDLLQDLLTRPAPTPPVARVTAKVESADVVAALLSSAGRAAIVGCVGTAIDASTTRQLIREILISALGSKEGRQALRAAVSEGLKEYYEPR